MAGRTAVNCRASPSPALLGLTMDVLTRDSNAYALDIPRHARIASGIVTRGDVPLRNRVAVSRWALLWVGLGGSSASLLKVAQSSCLLVH